MKNAGLDDAKNSLRINNSMKLVLRVWEPGWRKKTTVRSESHCCVQEKRTYDGPLSPCKFEFGTNRG